MDAATFLEHLGKSVSFNPPGVPYDKYVGFSMSIPVVGFKSDHMSFNYLILRMADTPMILKVARETKMEIPDDQLPQLQGSLNPASDAIKVFAKLLLNEHSAAVSALAHSEVHQMSGAQIQEDVSVRVCVPCPVGLYLSLLPTLLNTAYHMSIRRTKRLADPHSTKRMAIWPSLSTMTPRLVLCIVP